MAGSSGVRARRRRSGATGRHLRPSPSPAARVALLLLAVTGLLLALSMATRYGAYRAEVGRLGPGQVAAWKVLMKLFDVNSENNVPTWFSSMLLFGDALLAGVIAAIVRRAGGRDARHWAGMTVLLLLLSLDEVASLHERLQIPASAMLGGPSRGLLHFAWVLPGALLVLVVAVAAAGFVVRLPRELRRLVVAAGGVFFSAAVGLEGVGGIVLEAQGDRAAYLLVSAAEEGMEMAAGVLLLYAWLRVLRLRGEDGGYHLSAGVIDLAGSGTTIDLADRHPSDRIPAART